MIRNAASTEQLRVRVAKAMLAVFATLALVLGSLRTTPTAEIAFAIAQASAAAGGDEGNEPSIERRAIDRDAVVTDGSSRLGERQLVKRASAGDPGARAVRRQGFTPSPLPASPAWPGSSALALAIPPAGAESENAPSWRSATSPARARARLMVFLN